MPFLVDAERTAAIAMDIDAQKRAAAARALDFVRAGMRLGLGSGTTAKRKPPAPSSSSADSRLGNARERSAICEA